MPKLHDIWNGLDWSVLTNLLLSIIPALVCITLHELAHGYVAYRLGDDTAKRAGRLTLNPLKHIDIMGLAMMVIFKFGWAKPVPVNMWKFKNPKKGMAITAAAGPLSNIIIAVICLFIYGVLLGFGPRIGKVRSYFVEMLLITAYLSTALAIFNIIPIPPLDGSKVLYSFVSGPYVYETHVLREIRHDNPGRGGVPAQPDAPEPTGQGGELAHGTALRGGAVGF